MTSMASDEQASRAARSGSSALFGVGYAAAAAVTALGVWLAASAPASGPVTGAGRNVLILLSANLVLIAALALAAGLGVLKLLRGGARDAGARLHLRLATLFAAAALAPAVIVALFFGLIVTRGVDSWFSSRVDTVVENHASVARLLWDSQTGLLDSAVAATAQDLGRYVQDLRRAPGNYQGLLEAQLAARGFDSIAVVDRQGAVVVAAGERPDTARPDAAAFAQADREGAASRISEREDLVRVLFPLQGSDGLYVHLASPLPDGMLDRLRDSEAAVVAYREADDNRERVQIVFGLSYAETALLVLIGAVQLGLALATSISGPIASLVHASGRIAAGDLTARVNVQRDPEEIAGLSRAFNTMAGDLQTQQEALRAAGREAETRRAFIETVLSEVSAGVIGLDRSDRISALNRQAAALLDLGDEALDRPVVEVAPELADAVRFARRHGAAEVEVDVLRGDDLRRLRVRAGGGGEGNLVLTFDDVTRLVAAQRIAAWKDVARRIAHEIKNPLTPIQLSAERIRRKYRAEIKTDLEVFDRCTDTIIRQVGDIGRMVDEFSAFARMPAPKFADEDAAELLRRAVFAQKVASPDIDVQMIDPGETSAPLHVDGRMLSQALTNILKNAAEAIATRRAQSPDAGPSRILARLVQDERHVCFIVEDDGVGLPATGRDRLVEPYVTTREKGTGLGLAIVKRIMEDHGGELLLQDAVELSGARAVLRLPLQGAAAPLSLAAAAAE